MALYHMDNHHNLEELKNRMEKDGWKIIKREDPNEHYMQISLFICPSCRNPNKTMN